MFLFKFLFSIFIKFIYIIHSITCWCRRGQYKRTNYFIFSFYLDSVTVRILHSKTPLECESRDASKTFDIEKNYSVDAKENLHWIVFVDIVTFCWYRMFWMFGVCWFVEPTLFFSANKNNLYSACNSSCDVTHDCQSRDVKVNAARSLCSSTSYSTHVV